MTTPGRELTPPPPQTIRGVIIYHDNLRIDNRIRQVRLLRFEYGYDIREICQATKLSRNMIFIYLRQIEQAWRLYVEAFPEEFEVDARSLALAIKERRDLDRMLRTELGALGRDANPSNRVGVYKLIMRNLRELEELTGLLVARIQHGGEVSVKDEMRAILDKAPQPLREQYLDALSAIIQAVGPTTQPESTGSD